MQLIGMLDSPYVRRVAISMHLLGVPFEHRPVSVFRHFDEFQRINRVVKAPTLVFDDGQVLMDSALILDYVQALAGPARLLRPAGLAERREVLRIEGLALVACEKTVQLVYEDTLRPAEKRHEPWVARVRGQLLDAYALLQEELARQPLPLAEATITQAGISTAVAWRFTQLYFADWVTAARFPALQACSDAAEQLPAFVAAPPV